MWPHTSAQQNSLLCRCVLWICGIHNNIHIGTTNCGYVATYPWPLTSAQQTVDVWPHIHSYLHRHNKLFCCADVIVCLRLQAPRFSRALEKIQDYRRRPLGCLMFISLFSAKEHYNQWLFCGKSPINCGSFAESLLL